MNFIHSKYQASGKISNDDMIYTLSLFITEPEDWVSRFEWRKLTDLERCAVGVFWKSIGDAMLIDWSSLPGHGTEGFKNGLDFVDGLRIWIEAYEKKYMVPHRDNRQTADETTAILLYQLPASMKNFGEKLVCAVMNDRLRIAMM